MRTIPSSELIINDDGSIFHLHLRPEQLADTVILVGDPGRVELVASFFDTRECNVSNREFNTVTGTYKGKRMTVLSTGIGIGNIDISVTELDALANVDFETRQVKPELRRLTLLRLGTSGAIQPDIKVGEAVFSRMSIGFDGLLNYYKGRNEVCNLEYEQYEGRRITNFEMESSALAGMASLMGHRAATICTIIAQRIALDACTDYKPFVKRMIRIALDKLATI